jgi:hypothetical protein
MDTTRIKRLKDLIDQLEQIPPSPDRDRVLAEVRSRAVDLDTGFTPRAMLPRREPLPPAPSPPKRDAAPAAGPTPPQPSAPAAPPAARTSPAPAAFFFAGELLSLDDSLPLSPLPDVAPWTRGLRAS